MKKTIVASMAIALSVFLSGCGNKNEAKNQAPQDSTQPKAPETQNVTQENKITGSIKDLLGMGKSLKCTATNGNDKFTATSTTYVSGKKVRSDIVSQVENAVAINSHVLVLDDWMYTWSDGSNTGMKLNMTAMNQNIPPPPVSADNREATPPPANNQLENKSNYDCSSWAADDSLFQVPGNVTFTDQTSVMNNVSGDVQQKPTNMCDVCGSLPNATAQAQCKASCSQK
jgi:hypothetical protein